MKTILACLPFFLAVAVACTAPKQEPHLGTVECTPTADSYQCTLAHMQGSHPIRICWKLNVTCANGLATQAASCGDVSPLGRSVVLVPFGKIPQWEGCDTVTALSVSDVKVTVR
jgi:hypothetical protein